MKEQPLLPDGRRQTYSGQPINPEMGEGRHQDALRRMRERIADGLLLVAWDSTAIGDKDTHCSWGMCSNDVEQWPEADDHTFPDAFEEQRRVTPRDPPGGCPLDRRTGTEEESRWGCFFHCRVFKTREISDTRKGRKRSLALYDETIAAREAEHGRLTASDDDEPWRAA